MPLRVLDAFMPEQLGFFLQRDALLKQVHGKRVPEPVTHHVSVIGNLGGIKARLNIVLGPIFGDALLIPVAGPKDVLGFHSPRSAARQSAKGHCSDNAALTSSVQTDFDDHESPSNSGSGVVQGMSPGGQTSAGNAGIRA